MVKLLWVKRKGFFFKSTDFIRLDIGKILNNQRLVKKIGNKVISSLSKTYQNKANQRKTNKGNINFKILFILNFC